MLILIHVLVLACTAAYSSAAVLHNISCDFNDGHFCAYIPVGTPDAWQINHGDDERRFISPRSPVNGSSGFAELVEDRAGFDSPQIRLHGQHCFSVDYYIIGVTLSQLNIYAKPLDAVAGNNDFSRFEVNSYLLFVLNSIRSTSDAWQHYEATVDFRDDVYQILINGAANQNVGREFVAFDNLKVEEGPCQVLTDVKKCNFDHVVKSGHPEDIRCDWLTISNSPDSDHEQRLRVTREDEGLLGNYQFDHTTHTAQGGFILVNGNENPAHLRLPSFALDMGRHCLSFAVKPPTTNDSYYFRVIETGLESGRERVLLEYDDRGWNNTVGTHWEKQYVDINPIQPINVTLQVLGERLMLDSFQLERGSCKNNVDCDFRRDTCDWNLNDHWFVGRGRLGSLSDNSDADYDHNYLYHDFRARSGDSPRSIYSDYVRAGQYCFKFVFKREISTRVLITTKFTFGGQSLPERRTEADGEWEIRYVEIVRQEKFRIILEVQAKGFVGRNVKIFKLREVKLTNGPCV